MKRDCSTCICKEGSCYPSKTIFDKDKTCTSYDPDYEGYIAELEKENTELKKKNLDTQDAVTMQMYTNKANKEIADRQLTEAKELIREMIDTHVFHQIGDELYENEGYTELVEEAEQFLKE